MKTITIQAEPRVPGVEKLNALRAAGKIPCVMYTGGGECTHFSVPTTTFKELIYVPGFRTAQIELEGKTHSALIKESQFHPVSDALLHVDFLELREGVQVKAEIPVQTNGRAKGQQTGGIVYVNTPRLKVKGLPSKLMEYIEIDISELELNDSIRISELAERFPDLLFNHPETVSVVSVETSRAARAAAAEEAAAAAAKAAAAIAAPVVEGEEAKPEEGEEGKAPEDEEAKKEE